MNKKRRVLNIKVVNEDFEEEALRSGRIVYDNERKMKRYSSKIW